MHQKQEHHAVELMPCYTEQRYIDWKDTRRKCEEKRKDFMLSSWGQEEAARKQEPD